jgi:hypothetical protein
MYCLAIVVVLFGCGCGVTTSAKRSGVWADETNIQISRWRRAGDMPGGVFQESVQTPIASEVKNELPPFKGTWEQYWIWRCELLCYEGLDHDVDYIVTQRRTRGLKEIQALSLRTFRTPWQVFTNSVDNAIERESSGLPPPVSYRNWQMYWRSEYEGFRRNRNIGEKGIKYVEEKREYLHLPLER